MAVRTGLSQSAVSSLGFKPSKIGKSQTTPGSVRTESHRPNTTSTAINISQLLRLSICVKFKILFIN